MNPQQHTLHHVLPVVTAKAPERELAPWAQAAGWLRVPPTVDEYWAHWQSVTPFPAQLEIMRAIFGDTRFSIPESPRLICLIWGQGSGKDFLLAHILNFLAIRLSCHRNPQRLLDIPDGSAIHAVSFSFNAFNAQSVFLAELANAVASTRDGHGGCWWETVAGGKLRKGPDAMLQKTKVAFPSGLIALSTHCEKRIAEGLRILIAIMDEFEDYPFTPGSVPDKRGRLWSSSSGDARELFDIVTGNVATRFPRYGKVFLASYLKGRHTPLNYLLPELRDQQASGAPVLIDQRTTFEANPTRSKDDEGIRLQYELDAVEAARRFENRNDREPAAFYDTPERVRESHDARIASPLVTEAYTAEEVIDGRIRRWTRQQIKELHPSTVSRIIVLDPGKASSHFCLMSGYREGEQGIIDVCLEWIPDPANRVVVDFRDVQHMLAELRDAWQIERLLTDGWNSELLVRDAEQAGIPVTIAAMTPGSQLERARLTRLLVNNGKVRWNDSRITEALLTARQVRSTVESLPQFDHVKDCFHLLCHALMSTTDPTPTGQHLRTAITDWETDSW